MEPSVQPMVPAGRTIVRHMGQVLSRESHIPTQLSQNRWLHVSLMGVFMVSCRASFSVVSKHFSTSPGARRISKQSSLKILLSNDHWL